MTIFVLVMGGRSGDSQVKPEFFDQIGANRRFFPPFDTQKRCHPEWIHPDSSTNCGFCCGWV